MIKKINVKQILAAILCSLLLTFSTPFSALAFNPPSPPSPPEAPQAPEPPSEPEPPPSPPSAPEAPDAPEFPSSPDQNPPESNQTTSSNNNSNEDSSQTSQESTNSGNGEGSQNNSSTNSEDNTDTDVSNDADVSNDIVIESNTGDNSASRNVGDGVVSTGNSDVNAEIQTSLNNTSILGSGCCLSGSSATNSGNGADSQNSASTSSSSSSDTGVVNDALLDNGLVILSQTGDNDASRNTGDGQITTGDANLSTVVVNDANTATIGVAEFDVNDNQTGDIVLDSQATSCQTGCGDYNQALATNSGNGADSQNDASVNTENDENTNVSNNGEIVNDLVLEAISGQNDASRNVGEGDIETGDANVAANVVNALNSTIVDGVLYVVNIFGDLVGDIIMPKDTAYSSQLAAANSQNGADSENNASAAASNNQNTTLSNNATINNNLDVSANTGDNSTSFNNGDSAISTGDVDISSQVLNIANINSVDEGDPIWIVFVNNLGTWTGKILGASNGENYAASNGIEFIVDDQGNIIATNSENGAGSENNASVTTSSQSNINVENTANVTNNIKIVADTGHNSASRNVGGGSIATGDANVAVNLVNFINSNFVGRSVRVALVNVFGSWMGDFVTPGSSNIGGDNDSGPEDEGSLAFFNDPSDTDVGGNDNSQTSVGGSTNNGSEENSNSDQGVVQSASSGNLGLFSVASWSKNLKRIEDDSLKVAPISNSLQEEIGGSSFDLRLLLVIIPVAAFWLLVRKFRILKLFSAPR